MIYTRILVSCVSAVVLAGCQPKTPPPPAPAPSAATSAPSSAAAPGSADTSAPVAIVNGTPINRDFFDFYAKGVAGKNSIADLTAEQKQQALDTLIRAQVIAQE